MCVLTAASSSPPLVWLASASRSPAPLRKENGPVAAREWGNASKTRSSLPQSTVEHDRRELVAFCQQCWQFTEFRHGKGAIEQLHIFTDLGIICFRTERGMTGTLRGALTIEEIKKYVKHCLKPGKLSGPDKCPNELLKTMTEEEFVIVHEWVNEILTIKAKTDHTENGQKWATMNGTISQLYKGGSTNKTSDPRPVV